MNQIKKVSLLLLSLFLIAPIAAKDKLLILHHSGVNFETVVASLQTEVSFDFDVVKKVNDKILSPKAMKKIIKKEKPQIVILLNNNNIETFRGYVKSLDKDTKVLPSISLVSAFIENAIADIPNSAGITYEVPIVTSVVNLRSMMSIPKVRLGIVSREFLKDFIEKNKAFCEAEGIEVKTIFVKKEETKYKKILKNGLKELVKEHGANTIWVPNDPAFLTGEIIRDVWNPFMKKYDVPVIVGVENFLLPNINFGSFAVLPDHSAMGQQAANLVYSIQENNWESDNTLIEAPISIFKVLNFNRAKSQIDTTEVPNVDKIIQ